MHKQLKTIDIKEAWPDTHDEGYIHQFQPIPFTKFTSSRSNEFKDILPWRSLKWSQRVSQMITKTVPISTRIIIKYAMKQGIPLWIWWKVNGNWDNNMIRISQWSESHCRINTSIRRKKQTQKSRTVRSLSWIWVAKLTIWVRSFEFTRSISSTRIG